MKIFNKVALCLVLAVGIQMSQAAEARSILVPGKFNNDPSLLKRLMRPRKPRIRFGDDQVREITPRRKKQKSQTPVLVPPVVLKQKAQAAAIALFNAKRPVVGPVVDERNSVVPVCVERNFAVARNEAPKKRAAAQKLCNDILNEINADAANSKAKKHPVKRSEAFIRPSRS
jgi:hypothetical protein